MSFVYTQTQRNTGNRNICNKSKLNEVKTTGSCFTIALSALGKYLVFQWFIITKETTLVRTAPEPSRCFSIAIHRSGLQPSNSTFHLTGDSSSSFLHYCFSFFHRSIKQKIKPINLSFKISVCSQTYRCCEAWDMNGWCGERGTCVHM